MTQFTAVANSTMFDVCLNTYGTFDLMSKLLNDNNITGGVNYSPTSGQIFVFDETLVVESSDFSKSLSSTKFATK